MKSFVCSRLLARLVGVGTLLFVVALARVTDAQEVTVPVGLQAELIAKVASYDKNFAGRAGDKAHVLIITKPGNTYSARTATHLQSALNGIAQVGGLSHDESVVDYTGAPQLAELCRSRKIAIVYLTQGFEDQLEAIRASLDGVSVLSVAAIPEYVPKGIVLGFDLSSGKPKLLVQLPQAKKQQVAFKAEVLKLMRVLE